MKVRINPNEDKTLDELLQDTPYYVEDDIMARKNDEEQNKIKNNEKNNEDIGGNGK